MHLDASQRARVRRATRAPSDDPSEAGGELNIVPFLDIVTNLILFLLATAAVALAVAQIPVTLGGGRPGPAPHERLGLSVTLVRDGAIVATRDGQLSADCEHYAGGRVLTVGRRGSGPDFSALAACLAHVKTRAPEETSVVVAADPEVAYADVVRAMDAARGPDGARFPDLLLSAGVR